MIRKVLILILSMFLNFNINGQPCLKDFVIIDSTFYLNNNIYTGEYKCFSDDGFLLGDGFIKDGKLNGITNYYNKKGFVVEKVLFNNNVQLTRTFFQKNIMDSLVYTMKNNVLDGLSEKYFSNGKIRERGYYINGVLKDTLTLWDVWGKKSEQFINSDDYLDYRLFKYKKDGIYIKVKRTFKNSNKKEKFVIKEPY